MQRSKFSECNKNYYKLIINKQQILSSKTKPAPCCFCATHLLGWQFEIFQNVLYSIPQSPLLTKLHKFTQITPSIAKKHKKQTMHAFYNSKFQANGATKTYHRILVLGCRLRKYFALQISLISRKQTLTIKANNKHNLPFE